MVGEEERLIFIGDGSQAHHSIHLTNSLNRFTALIDKIDF